MSVMDDKMQEERQKENAESEKEGRDCIETKRFKPGDQPLNWTVSERSGWEVKVPSPDFDREIMELDTDDEKNALIWACENMTEPREGKKVLVMSLFGWVRGEVRRGNSLLSSPHVASGGHIFPLERSDDDRDCWVTTSQINKRVFEMGLEK